MFQTSYYGDKLLASVIAEQLLAHRTATNLTGLTLLTAVAAALLKSFKEGGVGQTPRSHHRSGGTGRPVGVFEHAGGQHNRQGGVPQKWCSM